MNTDFPAGPALEPLSAERDVRRLFSRTGLAVVLYFILSQAASFAVAALMRALIGDDFMSHGYYLAASLAGYGAGLISVCIFLRKDQISRAQSGISAPYLAAAYAVLTLFALIGAKIGSDISDIISNIIGQSVTDPLTASSAQMSLPETFAVMGICAPVFEELIFRKIVLGRTRTYGDGIAILVSSWVFGLMHANIYQFFYAFLAGIVFGYVYCKSNRLIFSVLLHFFFNTLNAVLQQFAETYSYDIIRTIQGVGQLLLAVVGVILLGVMFGKYKKDLSACIKNAGVHFAAGFFNTGMILAFVTSLIMYILTIVSYMMSA